MSRSGWLRRRARERSVTRREERLTRPVRREMKPEPSDAPDDAAGDFEQVETDRADGRRRQSRPRENRTTEAREQQEPDTVQLQAEGVRAEPMTAEAIGVDIELELLDPILRRAAVVVPRDKIGGAAPAIGDAGPHAETGRRDVDLDENPPVMGPRFRAMPKTGTDVHGAPAPLVTGLRLRDERRHARFEDAIRADAQHVIDA